MKNVKICLLFFLFSCLLGCTQLNLDRSPISDRSDKIITSNNANTKLAEVAAPKTIDKLNSSLEAYLPEVEIITPKAEQTFDRTDIEVQLKVENLPVFKDDTLELGNHINLVVDNEPLQPIYSIEEPIIIKNLSPGTHTIRVFAVRPWGESFKNEKAYAQTTFNVLTETNDNRPEPDVPLLTYNSPTGNGTEPLLLDFYLTNAPLHAIAQNNPNLKDWRIKATINGTSLILEDWQPIYLTGLEPGENWVQLELIDETGNSIENAFNNTVRVFTYDLQQNDALAKLMSDRLSVAQARSLINPNFIQPVEISKNIEQMNSIDSNTVDAIDTVAQSKPTAEVITPTSDNEPTVSTSKYEDEQIQQQAQSSLETSIFEPNIEPKVTPSEPEIPTSNLIVVEDSFETEHSHENSIATKDNSDLEPSVTTIIMPEPELVEASEAVAIADSETNFKSTTGSWWKKILVGLRQKIEALAKTLPDEV